MDSQKPPNPESGYKPSKKNPKPDGVYLIVNDCTGVGCADDGAIPVAAGFVTSGWDDFGEYCQLCGWS